MSDGPECKRPRLTAAKPEDLIPGKLVALKNGRVGTIRDAFAPLDQFWVADKETGALIRNKDGEVVGFTSKDLQLLSVSIQEPHESEASGAGAWTPRIAEVKEKRKAKPRAFRVLVVGTKDMMLKALTLFGPPDTQRRRETQMLLALPCATSCCSSTCGSFDQTMRRMCGEDCPLLQNAEESIDDSIRSLSSRLRPDIETAVRPFHLKQAIEKLGHCMQNLRSFYYLSAVTLPFSRADIASSTGWERHWKEELRCQIDLGVSAECVLEDPQERPQAVLQRALFESCGLQLSPELWEEAKQLELRRHHGIDVPVVLSDGAATKVFVLLVPHDASIEWVTEAGGKFISVKAPAAQGPALETSLDCFGGKTVREWKELQDQFKGLPKLPQDWIRIRARSGSVYFYNPRTRVSTFDFPLPDGWSKTVSKSTGKEYYFNEQTRACQFEMPTE